MKIGIFGMGAVGASLYHELYGYEKLYILVDEARGKRYKEEGFYINGVFYEPNCIHTGVMDLIIVCVKNYQLSKACDDLKPFIQDSTIILPLLNGITAHDDIQAVYPKNKVLYGVINVEANKTGNSIHTSRILNLQFGEEYNHPMSKEVGIIDSIFSQYKIRHRVYPDMKKRVWSKWMMNMGINQVSALCNATYKDMSHPLLQDLIHDVFYEVYEVSKAYNIGLTEEDVEENILKCRDFSSDRVTSLTIDFNMGTQNELECFSPTLIRMARKKGIEVPVTMTLYRLLKSLDDKKQANHNK